MYALYFFILISVGSLVFSEELKSYNVLGKLFNQCLIKDKLFKCLKVQAAKIMSRALLSRSLNIIDGVTFITNGRQCKTMKYALNVNDSQLQKLDSDELDEFLSDASSSFLDTHQLEIRIPRLLEEERKKQKEGGNGALYWALAIKGSFLAMAYKGIAVMAGLALIMGKMALLLSAILGLKKLVHTGHETTTFEIIKQPKYTEEHTHSTSYEDEGHHHHRSYDYSELHSAKRDYKGHI